MPYKEIDSSLRFYDEAICERMEHGMSETEATAAVGTPEDAAGRILAELPDDATRRAGAKRSFRLIAGVPSMIIGMPVIIALLAAAAAVVISVAAVVLAITISLFAAAFALIVAVIPAIYLLTISGSLGNGLMCLSAACASAGAGILCMLGAVGMTKAVLHMLKKHVFTGRRREKA